MNDQVNIKQESTGASDQLFQNIAEVIQQAHQHVQQAVNQAMVQSYWQIGCLIVEHEQKGNARAAYGKQQLQLLSKRLTNEFGKGFDASNLRNMRSFYLCFPKWDAVSHKLSWTHYRKLIRIENQKARAWYQQETIERSRREIFSTHRQRTTLRRQVSALPPHRSRTQTRTRTGSFESPGAVDERVK